MWRRGSRVGPRTTITHWSAVHMVPHGDLVGSTAISRARTSTSSPPPGGEQVKLLDLGFAKVEDELKLTSKDHLLGTPSISAQSSMSIPAWSTHARICSRSVS